MCYDKEKQREFDYRRGDGNVTMEAETGGCELKMEKAPQVKVSRKAQEIEESKVTESLQTVHKEWPC